MRLIDADALTKEIEDFNCKDCNHYNHVRCRACPIDDTVTYIDEAPTVGEWISVEDRLPDKQPCEYLVVNGNNVETAICLDNRWITPRRVIKITHWMSLPEPPKEESDD